MAQPERREEVKASTETEIPGSPSLNRRQFLALCAAGASAVLFGAACGGEGENGDDEEQEEEQDDEEGGGEEGDGEQDEGGY